MSATASTESLLQGQRAIRAEIAAGAPLRQVLGSIARYSELCTPEMLASILWYEASTGALRRGGHSRLPDAFADTVDGLVPAPTAGSCGTAAFLRQRVVSVDVQVDPLWSAFREFAAQHGIRSAWSTPLLSPSDGSLLGVFGMYYPDCREPSESDLQLVDHFTHLAAIAIERDRRDAALRESERQRHRNLLALAGGIAHELNTPLGVARTVSSLMAEEIAALPSEAGESVGGPLALLSENIERALGMVRAFRSTVVEQQPDPFEVVELGEQVQGTVNSLSPVLASRRIAATVAVAPGAGWWVRCATVRLGQVITNLVVNAATHAYGPEGGPLRIGIGPATAHPDFAAIVFSDEGRGMSAEVAARCVEPFFTTARTTVGTGLGLFLAKHVVEAELGGSLLLETAPGAGVRWTILVPLAKGVATA